MVARCGRGSAKGIYLGGRLDQNRLLTQSALSRIAGMFRSVIRMTLLQFLVIMFGPAAVLSVVGIAAWLSRPQSLRS